MLALLAATKTTQPVDVLTWIGNYAAQFGIFGLAFLDVFVTRKLLIPKWALEDAIKAKDDTIAQRDKYLADKNEDIKELKASLAQLQNLTRDQILPALVRANQLSADYVQEITRRAYTDERPVRRKRVDGV